MSQIIDEQGNPQAWTAHYWRYHSRYTYEADSLEEAIGFLREGEYAGDLSAHSVAGPDGAVVIDESEIFDAAYGHGRFAPERLSETIAAIGGAR